MFFFPSIPFYLFCLQKSCTFSLSLYCSLSLSFLLFLSFFLIHFSLSLFLSFSLSLSLSLTLSPSYSLSLSLTFILFFFLYFFSFPRYFISFFESEKSILGQQHNFFVFILRAICWKQTLINYVELKTDLPDWLHELPEKLFLNLNIIFWLFNKIWSVCSKRIIRKYGKRRFPTLLRLDDIHQISDE